MYIAAVKFEWDRDMVLAVFLFSYAYGFWYYECGFLRRMLLGVAPWAHNYET